MGAKVSISLTEKIMAEIKQRIDNGEYTSVSEVVRAGLRSLSRDEEEHRERIEAIRTRIGASLDDPRPAVPAKDAFERIRNGLLQRYSGR